MTAADHANAVRRALKEQVFGSVYRKEVIAALDALQAEADRWQEIEHPFDQSEYNAMHESLVAAEAERDRLADALRPFAATTCVHTVDGQGPDVVKRLQEQQAGCAYCNARAALAGGEERWHNLSGDNWTEQP